jgi:sporulation-control protein spo0M
LIGRIKHFLNIEGIKATFELDDGLVLEDSYLSGHLLLQSQRSQEIKAVRLKLYELYERGRGDGRKTSTIIMGQLHIPVSLIMNPKSTHKISFKLPYRNHLSAVEQFGQKNIFFKSIASGLQTLNGVRSQYYLEAKVDAVGVAFSPMVETRLFPV